MSLQTRVQMTANWCPPTPGEGHVSPLMVWCECAVSVRLPLVADLAVEARIRSAGFGGYEKVRK
jgi:hypothetical protein